jgi:hypothetical protein
MSEEISPLENHNWWMKQLRKDAKANRPEALALADALGRYYTHLTVVPDINREAAAELRRLHALNGELLEALQDLCDTLGDCGMTEKARAAIAKAEGKV